MELITNLNRIYAYWLKFGFKSIFMKFTLTFLVVFLLANTALAQVPLTDSGTKIYLVRHAEKDTGNNPVLTIAGCERAGDLVRLMKDRQIQRIYVTPYRRSQMTADSLRIQLGIDTVQYKADTTGAGLIKRILENNDAGKSILVIGHSNTILRIARGLGVENIDPLDIPDHENDNVLLVKYKNGKAELVKWKYGALSKPAPPKAMQ